MFSFFAKSCLLCHASCTDVVCTDCLGDLRATYTSAQQMCPKCAKWSLNGEICGECRVYPPPYEKLWACAPYRGVWRGLIHHWKHLQRPEFGAVFDILLRENPPPWLQNNTIDAILAMPISHKRRLQRGFNQCDELAMQISRDYKIPILPPQTVFRVPKPPQTSLNATQREHNIQNVFRVDGGVKNRKILIIDDVMTTGATLGELSRTLRQSGAAAVFACVVLRNL